MLAHNANMDVYLQWRRFAGAVVCRSERNEQALRHKDAALHGHGTSETSAHLLSHLFGKSISYQIVET